MAHVAKYTKSQSGGLTRHFERAKNKETGEYLKFSNQEIDTSKSHENYNLATHKIEQLEFIRKRCSEVKCLNRKDVNVMASWVVTAPKTLPKEDEKKFFQESYNFLKHRYGEKNIISAYVHVDETQPHIHFAFVPVVKDKKTGIEKVSAKECLNRKDLQSFHNDFDTYMTKEFGRDIGVINKATKDGNKSIVELKRQSASERMEVVKDNIHKSEDMLKNAQDEVFKVKHDVLYYQYEKNRLEGQIEAYKGTLNTFAEIDNIGKKNLMGKITMTAEESDKLKEQAKAYFSANRKAIDVTASKEYLSKKYDSLNNKFQELKSKFKSQDENFKLVQDVIRSNPELHKKFNEQYKIFHENQKQEKNKQELKQDIKNKLRYSRDYSR